MNTPVRRVAAGAAGAVLLAATAGCTGGSSTPAGAPSPSPSSAASTGSPATMNAKPVPLKVLVTRVSGKLSPKARRDLEGNVGKVVSGYLDAAFLSGHYPRSDFSDALREFTRGARRQAHRDRGLLTNQILGPTTESVTPKEEAAYLSVLAPYKVAAGVSANLRLRFVADRGDKPAKQVTVTGRLLLTRKKSGGWAIFGYHLSRSARTVREGS